MNKHNFSAGPAILPDDVKRRASIAAYDYDSTGLSLMEMSHRGKEFTQVLERAELNVRNLFKVDDSYAVLFLTGGASSQFYMSAMNLAGKNDKIAYLDTGTWAKKAIKEAKLFTNVDVVASSADNNYSYIPKDYKLSDDTKYLHLTSNNTIFGTQIKTWPSLDCPMVCDMSSDIFSRNIPVEKFDLIYAGAQKNVGPAGVTLVIVKKEILGKVERDIPTMLKYQTHIDKGSSFNTPPVFPIYVTMLTLDWIIQNGGVSAMEVRNSKKANALYNEIDNNPLFTGCASIEDRSDMNATFLLNNEDLNSAFSAQCEDVGIVGLTGHRSVGGYRASMYNAMGQESVEVLINVMKEFAQKNG